MLSLLWLRWHELLDEVGFWLRLVDYDVRDRSRGNQAYALYLLLFFVWWTVGVVAIASESATGIGHLLNPVRIAPIRAYAPAAVFIGQIVLFVWAMRTSPLKVSAPDMAYLSNAQNIRIPLMLLGFAQSAALPLLIGGVTAYFGTLILGGNARDIYRLALRSGATALVAVGATWALAWLLGCARMALRQLRHVTWIWLTPLPLLAMLLLQPSPAMQFWQPYTDLLFAQPPTAQLWLHQLILASVALVGLVFISTTIDMTAVREESALHAQISEISNLRILAPSVYARATRNIKSVRVKRRLPMPETGSDLSLVVRSVVTYVREPSVLLHTLPAAVIVATGIGLLFSKAPVLLLAAWLYGAMLIPTKGLTHTFRLDTEDPFLRQLLRIDPLHLLAFESAVATGLTAILGVLLALPVLMAQDALMLGIPLAICMAIMLTWCHGASALPLTDYRAKVSHSVLIVLTFGLTLGIGFAMHSPFAALGLCVIAIGTLSSLIASSHG